MENELHNMRKEMDELRSALKDKGRRIWIGWFEGQTHHSSLKYWTISFDRNSISQRWNHITVSRTPWITLNHSWHWCHYRWPQTRCYVGHSQRHWKEQSEYGSARYTQKLLQILNNIARVLFIIYWGAKTHEANWSFSQHSIGRRRITKTVRDPIQ